MEKITYRITLDTLRNGVQRVLQGFQTGDRYARSIDISLVSGSVSYELPLSNITAAMYVTINGETSVNECTIDANKITYDIQNEDIATEGTVQMQLKIIETRAGGAQRVLVSPNFAIEVCQSDTDDEEAEDTQTFTALENALAQAQEYSNSTITHVYIDDDNLFVVEFADETEYTSTVIQDALSSITNVEAYAEAALAAKNAAEASKVSAAASATSAATSATSATTAADSATLSASSATSSATNAAASAAAALASQGAAATSATNAATSESNASSSASDAATSESNAATSASNAATSATAADLSERNASDSATSAIASADSAEASASSAYSYEQSAKGYKETCEQIASSLQGGFIPMGTITFSNLPANASAGWMYNVSDSFVSDSRFKDGGGRTYAAGTNVYLTSDSKWDCLSGDVPTVNGKVGNSITLDGSDIAVTGYSKASSQSAIAVTDSINTALGKLEKKADDNKANFGNYVSTSNVISDVSSAGDYSGKIADATVTRGIYSTVGGYGTQINSLNGEVSSLSTTVTSNTNKIDHLKSVNEFTLATTSWADSSGIASSEYTNLITLPYTDGTSKTLNGVTFTVDGNGYITVNGTASGNVPFVIKDISSSAFSSGTYTICGCPSGGSDSTFKINTFVNNTWNGEYGSGYTFAYSSGSFKTQIVIMNGYTANNLVFKPLLVSGSVVPSQGGIITSADAEKYPKYAKVTTDKYDANFIPQYVDVIPSGNFFSDDEESAKGIMSQTVIFADDGFYAFAEETPSCNVKLRIGGVK